MKKPVFWAIIGLALIYRLIYFTQIKSDFLFRAPILDAKYYHDWAVEIAKGNWLGAERGVFMMSPGYSYFLGVIYKIFGVHISIVVLLQFLMGILAGYLLFLIGRKLFSETIGYISMAFYLFYPVAVFYESTLLKSPLINLVNVLVVYLLLGGGALKMLLGGMLAGFSVHLRPNILVFIPVVLFYLWKTKKEYLKYMIYFCLGLALMLLPAALRNYKAGGEFVFSTAHGGMNIYTGNSQYCKGPYTPLPFARTDPEVEQADFLQEAQRRSGKQLTPRESSAFWYAESFKFIKEQPLQWVNLLGRKVLIFLNSYEPPINLDFYFFRQEYKSILSLPLFNYGVILPLALIGIFLTPLNLLLGGYMAVYFISGIIFFVVSEYRFPIVPVLCVYAASGAVYMYNLYSKGISRRFLAISAVFAALLFLVNADIYSKVFGFTTYRKANLANSYFGMGSTYESKNMIDEAIAAYKKAIEIMPQSAPLVNLASIYEARGDLGEAQKYNEIAIKYNPYSAEAFNNLGVILYKKGDFENAARCFRQAVMLGPNFAQARKNLEVTMEKLKKQ